MSVRMTRNQLFLLLLISILLLLTFIVILPFMEYVIAAGVLAYVLHPVHSRLRRRVGERISTVLLLLSSLIAIILPVAYISWVFMQNLRQIARGQSGLDVDAIELQLSAMLGVEVDVSTGLTTMAQQLVVILFGGTSEIVAGTFKATLGIALAVFLVYYMLLEGEMFVTWLRDLIPLSDRVTNELFEKIDATTWGVVIAEISVAIAQAILGGIALWFVGIPNPVFWTFVMAVFALLPIVGAFVIWGPAALYLIAIEQTVPGIFLFVWGLTVVSFFDNYARPIVIDQRAHINPAVILVGVLGGLYAIGFTGLFVGPVLIGVLVSTLEIFRTEFDTM